MNTLLKVGCEGQILPVLEVRDSGRDGGGGGGERVKESRLSKQRKMYLRCPQYPWLSDCVLL